MAQSVATNLPAAPRKPLRMRGESVPDSLRIDENKRAIGRAIDEALAATGIKKDSAARDMGYGENQTSLGEWIAGRETPQFAKLRLLGDAFWQELAVRLLALSAGVEVRRVVTVLERKAVNS